MIQQRQKRMRNEARPFELDAPEEFQRCESGRTDLSYGLVFAQALQAVTQTPLQRRRSVGIEGH